MKISDLRKGVRIPTYGSGGSRPFNISIWTVRGPDGNNLLVSDGSVAHSTLKLVTGGKYPQLVEGHSLFIVRGETRSDEGEIIPADFGYRPDRGGEFQCWWVPQRLNLHQPEALPGAASIFGGTLASTTTTYGDALQGHLLVPHDKTVVEADALLVEDREQTVARAISSGKATRAFLLKLALPEAITPEVYRIGEAMSSSHRVADPLVAARTNSNDPEPAF